MPLIAYIRRSRIPTIVDLDCLFDLPRGLCLPLIRNIYVRDDGIRLHDVLLGLAQLLIAALGFLQLDGLAQDAQNLPLRHRFHFL